VTAAVGTAEGASAKAGGQSHMSIDCPKHRYADDILRSRIELDCSAEAMPEPASLVEWGLRVLSAPDPRVKCALTHRAMAAWAAGGLPVGTANGAPLPDRPARPEHPKMVPFFEVPKQPDSGMTNATYVLHQLAHVELNAIDLAWDTVVRYAPLHKEGLLPAEFYEEFAWVADDESRHLGWALARMGELEANYGDIPAHDNLWDCARVTFDDLEARLAVVPMVQEARGLDAGPRLAMRLVGWGDNRSAEVVRQISLEEIEHVAVGVRWFRHLCEGEGLDPGERFKDKVEEHCAFLMKGPYNHESRQLAGMEREWYEHITAPPPPPGYKKGDFKNIARQIK